jgi:hypothetical protein
MTQTVLPQLQEVIQDLEAQESVLATQLAEVQVKLEAVRAVLPMFGESAVDIPEPAAKAKPPAVTAKKKAAKKSASTAKVKASAKSEPAEKPAQKPKVTSKKKDGRAATWQKYTLPGVGDRPMPEAVEQILATKPEEDFKIAEVMSGLFKEDMPKAQYLKARNRISNILSGGVRDGAWHKGDRGAYRLKAAS